MELLRLLVKGPGREERIYEIRDQEATIGRDPGATIPIDDRTLSRRHCRVYAGPDGWRLTDLGSRNGTLLNGTPILDDRLAEGDRIELGETEIAVHLPEGAAGQERNLAVQALVERRESRRAAPDTRREIRALTHLMELNEKLNGMAEEDTLLEGILDAAIELTGASRAFLLLKQESHFVVRRARMTDHRELADPKGALSVRVATRVIEEGKTILAEDAVHDARFDGTASVANLELRSLVCVPLRSAEPRGPQADPAVGVIGAIYLDNPHEKGAFDGWDVRILESFASLASVALRNTRQRAEGAQRRREAVRQARRIERLNERLRRALRIRTTALKRAREDLAKQADELGLRFSYSQIVGRSPAMRTVLKLVDRVTDLNVPVLIVGESGTGKELIARAIHFNGPRRRGRIVGENCAAIPANLMESEFFGYVRGAFTGAQRDTPGLVEQAHQGTLFLDEVGDLPLELQKKLLRVLEEGEVRRLGGKKAIPVDFRLVCATNRDLLELLHAKSFREDLYYRIAGVVIELPPVRERREDIPALVHHFLKECSSEDRPLRIDPAALELMSAYEWPGNVREIRNEVQRLAALEAGGLIRPEHLSPRILVYKPPDPSQPIPQGLRGLVEDLERRTIRASLLRHGWNKSRAALELGLSRLGLRKKLERYGIDEEQPPAS